MYSGTRKPCLLSFVSRGLCSFFIQHGVSAFFSRASPEIFFKNSGPVHGKFTGKGNDVAGYRVQKS